jgi:fatty acid desaturase
MRAERKSERRRTYLVSRSIICLIVGGSLGSLLWVPAGSLQYSLDILVRTYLLFLGTVMAHEGVHGHLGGTKRANSLWGRIALIPSLVPFTNFRRTHHLHHAHTNEPDSDPDFFMKSRHPIEIPFRALAMPHQWYFWLKRRSLLNGKHRRDLYINYAVIAGVYAAAFLLVGPARLALGVLPALVLVSILLWYPFALKTHEGHSVGSSETRSHDYYGHFLYWFSLGLSLHRVHHEKPQLSWIELKSYVRPAPGGSWGGFIPRRDIRLPDRVRTSLVLWLLIGGIAASPAAAQWRALSTTGYAAGGLAAAVGPAFAANSYEGGLTALAAGLGGGLVVGWLIGDSAGDRLERGEALSNGHKHAIRAGTVMAGAGVGALASFLVINGSGAGGEGIASDESIFGSFVAGGAALGVLTQALLDSRLEPAALTVVPAVGGQGRTEIALTVTL